MPQGTIRSFDPGSRSGSLLVDGLVELTFDGRAMQPSGLRELRIGQRVRYTRAGDAVLDVMAGSGTTGDVCRAMDRHDFMTDLQPKRGDIAESDVTDWPRLDALLGGPGEGQEGVADAQHPDRRDPDGAPGNSRPSSALVLLGQGCTL